MEELVLGIISDMHCTVSGEKYKTTYLYSDLLPTPKSHHPIEALKDLIKTEGITADVLLCTGDITDQINKQGFISGWGFLNQIKQELKATQLIATTGNHDIDSKNIHKLSDFKTIAQNLSDNYPISDRDSKRNFWADGFFFLETDSYIVLDFNSCFNHFDEIKAREAIITDDIINKIKTELHSFSRAEKFKIALFHHHPTQYSNLEEIYKDGDVLKQGDKLLNLLQDAEFHIVIHGHKHIPRLEYYNSNLPLFCSGSFSSLRNLKEYSYNNTFHLLTLKRVSIEKDEYVGGQLKTWEFIFAKGWQSSEKNVFAADTGFGAHPNLDTLARDIAHWLEQEHGENIVDYQVLVTIFPTLKFIIPFEQEKLEEKLKVDYGVDFTPSLVNKPKYIQKMVL